MGMYIRDSDGAFYVEKCRIIHDDRGHRKIFKRFHTQAEAEAFMLNMIEKGQPEKTPDADRRMNGKHRKSHRLKRPK